MNAEASSSDAMAERFVDALSLHDRHILIVGAGLGIGKVVARAARGLGARVSCADIDATRARATAEAVQGLALVVDANDRSQLKAALDEAVAHYGPLHGVVDIVGGSTRKGFRRLDDDDIHAAFRLNLLHVIEILRLCPDAIGTDGASFVFVSSVLGSGGSAGRPLYGAMKAALDSLVRSAAVELAPSIRVNAVAPGQIRTPRLLESRPPEYWDRMREIVPLGDIGEPVDVARALIFFLSDLSSWITGQVLTVDGGTGSVPHIR